MNSNTLNIKKIKRGKAERMSFAKTEVPYVMPDALTLPKESYKKFLEEDIGEILNEFNPIVDYSNKAELSFLSYSVEKTPKYPWNVCKTKQVSYTVPLKVMVRLLVKETGQIMDQEVFLGDIPYLGRLFRSHAEQTVKRNLLIFVTGRLITPSGRELNMNATEQEEAEERMLVENN